MNTRKLLSQCASVPYLSSRWIAKIDWGQREYDSMSSEGVPESPLPRPSGCSRRPTRGSCSEDSFSAQGANGGTREGSPAIECAGSSSPLLLPITLCCPLPNPDAPAYPYALSNLHPGAVTQPYHGLRRLGRGPYGHEHSRQRLRSPSGSMEPMDEACIRGVRAF